MFVDSQLLLHKKSQSVCELTPALKKPPPSSPQTSPLLKRALSPSERKKSSKPRRSITLPREVHKKRSPKMVSIITPREEVHAEEELDEVTTLL